MIEKPSGTPVNKGALTYKPKKQEAPRWLNNRKTIAPKALIVKDLQTNSCELEKSMLPRVMTLAMNN